MAFLINSGRGRTPPLRSLFIHYRFGGAAQQVFLTRAMLTVALQDCEDIYVETEEA